jgi:PD-(D/E)XK nuclease superfamily
VSVCELVVPGYEPVSLSWSRLRTHDECPAKGDLLSRHRKSPYADIRNYFHGNVVDLTMRRWLSQESPEMGWMAAQVDAIFDESIELAKSTGDGIVKWKGPDDRTETQAFCRELVVKLEEILAKYCLPFDWNPAWRFKVPLTIAYGREMRQITLRGEIDLLVFDKTGRIAVWDLKATQNNEYWRKVLGQLVFYNLAVRCSEASTLGKWPVMSGLFQPMCDQPVLPVTVTPQAIREMAGRIERVAGDIWAGRMPAKPDAYRCGSCEVRHACPAWGVPDPSGTVQMVG